MVVVEDVAHPVGPLYYQCINALVFTFGGMNPEN